MTSLDPRYLSFSQAQGYEPMPQLLQLGELNDHARVALWNVVYIHTRPILIGEDIPIFPMEPLLDSMYTDFLLRPLDLKNPNINLLKSHVKPIIISHPFNRVFDLLLFFMRHPECPDGLIDGIATTFERHHLAYFVDKTPPITIYPISTPEEGVAIVDALNQLKSTDYRAAREYLRKATECINGQDWSGAVRESIHAVESVARQIAPEAKTLGEALPALKKRGLLKHTALQRALSSLYGYTSDEPGIRHAGPDKPTADVGQDEALFMFGACASFASYLSRKQTAISE